MLAHKLPSAEFWWELQFRFGFKAVFTDSRLFRQTLSFFFKWPQELVYDRATKVNFAGS